MKTLSFLLILAVTAPARADILPSFPNLAHRIEAGVLALLGRTYYWHRSVETEPIFRPRRVPLYDVGPCAGDAACVIVNGRRVTLEPTPTALRHGRVQVVGLDRHKATTNIYARVRFGAWVNADPDVLHVWAEVRHAGRRVKILGYSIQQGEAPGRESEALAALSDFSALKFLTSRNAVEVEVARELTERRVFCLKNPANPVDSIRDDVAPLEAHGLIDDDDARRRLAELNAVAAVIDHERGATKCDSPVTDQMDIVLDQVRGDLEGFARRAPFRQGRPAAAPPPVEIPAPSPAPPTQGIPFLTPPRPTAPR